MSATSPDSAQDTPPSIDFYFDFLSPFGWIGAERIGAVARRFGRAVEWHPFLLKATVIETMGLKPLLETPLKGDYVRHDVRRSLRYHGLNLADDARFTFSSVLAARAALWARATTPEHVEALILGLYRAHWAQGRDISCLPTVLDIIEETGLPGSVAVEVLNGESIKTALRDETAAAIRRGVFGSPTLIVDGEMFWGSDRIPMAEAWLETGGW